MLHSYAVITWVKFLQDEFDQHVSAISNFYSQQKETIAHLNKHIKDRDATIKKLQLDYDTLIKQLKDTVSDQKSQIEMLLKEKDRWLNSPKFCSSFDYASVSSYAPSSGHNSKDSSLSVDDSYGPPPSLIHDDSLCYPDSEKDLGLSPPNNKVIHSNYSIF